MPRGHANRMRRCNRAAGQQGKIAFAEGCGRSASNTSLALWLSSFTAPFCLAVLLHLCLLLQADLRTCSNRQQPQNPLQTSPQESSGGASLPAAASSPSVCLRRVNELHCWPSRAGRPVYVHVKVHVHVHVHVKAKCQCKCICIYIYVYIGNIYIYTHKYVDIHMCVCACACVHVYVHGYVYVYVYVQAYVYLDNRRGNNLSPFSKKRFLEVEAFLDY